MILLVGLFVENDLIVPLIEDSFSHVLILLESHHLLNVFLDDDNQVFIGLLLLTCIPTGSPCELVFELEELCDVLSSHLFQVFVDLGLHLFGVSVVVSGWVDRGADLLTQRDQGSSWANRSEEFENVTICHRYLLRIY